MAFVSAVQDKACMCHYYHQMVPIPEEKKSMDVPAHIYAGSSCMTSATTASAVFGDKSIKESFGDVPTSHASAVLPRNCLTQTSLTNCCLSITVSFGRTLQSLD